MQHMKLINKYQIIAAMVIVATMFFGCDYIEFPYTVPGPNGCTVVQPDFTPRTSPVRKVLVEEFTGHRCGNCPRGAETITNLIGTYGEQVIGIAHHTYNLPQFTEPLPNDTTTNPELHYLYDFRTQESLTIDEKFGVNIIGVPTGFVNRRNFGSGVVMAYTSWTSRVSTALSAPPQMDIQLKSFYNAADSSVCVYYFVEALENVTGNFKIAMYITEDSIVKWQKDYNVIPNDIEFYVHNHIMRKAINGTNGTAITTNTSLVDGESFIDGYSTKLNLNLLDLNHLHIVAFVYNADNDEIIQAEEIKLIP